MQRQLRVQDDRISAMVLPDRVYEQTKLHE